MTEEATTNTATDEPTGAGSAPDTNAATPNGNGDTPKDEPNEVAGLKAAVAAERKKRQEAEAKAKEFDDFKRKQEDEAAQKANDVEKFRTERDKYEGEAKQWREYANAKLESIAEGLDDSGKAILDALGEDVSLAKRLTIAEQLSSQKKTEPGFGTKGGKPAGDSAGVIPSDVKTPADFRRWWGELMSTPKGRQQVADPEFNKKVTAERQRRFG